MCDNFYPDTAYYAEISATRSTKSLFQKDFNEPGWIVYNEFQDVFFNESECFMCKQPKSEENPFPSSEPKEKTDAHQTQAIIPDYLLEKIQEHHQKEEALPSVVEQDQRSQEESEKFRKQRVDHQSTSSEGN